MAIFYFASHKLVSQQQQENAPEFTAWFSSPAQPGFGRLFADDGWLVRAPWFRDECVTLRAAMQECSESAACGKGFIQYSSLERGCDQRCIGRTAVQAAVHQGRSHSTSPYNAGLFPLGLAEAGTTDKRSIRGYRNFFVRFRVIRAVLRICGATQRCHAHQQRDGRIVVLHGFICGSKFSLRRWPSRPHYRIAGQCN